MSEINSPNTAQVRARCAAHRRLRGASCQTEEITTMQELETENLELPMPEIDPFAPEPEVTDEEWEATEPMRGAAAESATLSTPGRSLPTPSEALTEALTDETPTAKPAKSGRPAKPAPTPVNKPLVDGLTTPKIDRKTLASTEASTARSIDSAASNALAIIPILESNLELSIGILPSLAKLNLDGLVAAYNGASSLETAGWVTKAAVAYNLREKVISAVTERASFEVSSSDGIKKISEQVTSELAKFASKLNASAKTLSDYHRIYKNFFANSPGNGPEGDPVTQEDVFNACRNGLTFSIFVELDRAPERGKALCIVLDKKLASESVTVQGVRHMVDIMVAAAKFEADPETETKPGTVSAPTPAPVPRTRPVALGGLEKPIAALPGRMVDFINCLTRAANDLAIDKDPLAVRYVFIDNKGLPVLTADQPVPVAVSDGGNGGVVAARIRKDSFGLVAFLADEDEDSEE